MALLDEYVLTPDIFDMTYYSSKETGDLHLKHLKEVILNEALVRNLRREKDSWKSVFGDKGRPWHKRGIELLKKLVIQNRVSSFDSVLPNDPVNDEDWCYEALASHKKEALTGVVTSSSVARSFKDESLVSSVDKLLNAHWWHKRSSSIRLRRTLSDYQENLHLILQRSKSVMFVDPHLDPSLRRYNGFVALLSSMPAHISSPLIEIHRVCYSGSGKNRIFPKWKDLFERCLSDRLRKAGLSIEVFIWADFHDRYLVSNLVGISLPNGFDTSNATGNITTWTRLGRSDRDDVQREFDQASNTHKLKTKFRVP
jgi:hypothetical protein